jgi:hypothetical protein
MGGLALYKSVRIRRKGSEVTGRVNLLHQTDEAPSVQCGETLPFTMGVTCGVRLGEIHPEARYLQDHRTYQLVLRLRWSTRRHYGLEHKRLMWVFLDGI